MIVVADHAHTLVERSISLGAQFADFDVRRPTDMRALERSQIAICPAQRAAMIYVFSPTMLERVLARAQRIDGVEQVIWREGEEACVARGGELLRFAPGERARGSARPPLASVGDARGARAARQRRRRAQRRVPRRARPRLGRVRVRERGRGAAYRRRRRRVHRLGRRRPRRRRQPRLALVPATPTRR